MSGSAGDVEVLIASPLEAEHVAAIEAVDPRVRVLYAPELLPVPRYEADHEGCRRELAGEELRRWQAMLARAEVAFDLDWWAPGAMSDNCPRLRWVQGTSAGMAGQLARADLPAGTVVTTASGVHGVPMAEFAVAGALHFIKDLPGLRKRQEGRRWERHPSRTLAGRRALVVGLGAIGRETARVFSALGVEVWGAGRPGRSYDVPGVSRHLLYTELASALPRTDVLVLAVPLTAETKGLIGETELRLLPEGALIVNMARGSVIDEEALVSVLRDGHLGGAALDVFATEPLPPESPLWGMDNVLVSPHSAATVAEENARITEVFTGNLRRWLDGLPLRNVFDPVRGY
ncbi:MAG TPA: D-2-hydroxyacid dehydrogenase [Actinomadura sp.]|jgi:phosphoglycerate dehydrogenase-like enzyme|nr:D-2-hydroxyacid dehydrogenase [Actinomadura sp.]